MSVLIRDWDMPKGCICTGSGNACYLILKCFNPKDGVPPMVDKRPPWCPLVEVPTPHGRLIDERDLCRAIIADCTIDERQKMFKIVESVVAVIEAEE